MRNKPRFVTASDFYNYTGKELNALLKVNNNSSNVANIFLMQVEDRLLARLDVISCRTTDWGNLTDYQMESLQKAIITQAEYILRNSDLFTDSGYDLEKGEVISFEKLQNITICKSAIDFLYGCGLYSHVMINRNRYVDFR